MAETAVPSVRGRTRTVVATLLVVAATTSGAVAGLVAAVLLAPVSAVLRAVIGVDLGADSPTVALALVGAAVVLDVVQLTTGRLEPPTGGRQVPREWGRVFGPATVAGLYGARLGVGPLTILSTWTWWAVTIAAGLLGPAEGLAVGATFGFVRMAATVALSLVALDPAHSARYRRLGERRRPGWATLNGTAAVFVAAMAMAGCGSGPASDDAARPRLRSEAIPALTVVTGNAANTTDDGVAHNGAGAGTDGIDAAHTGASVAEAPPSPTDTEGFDFDFETMADAPGADQTPLTVPAQLEDFVRPNPADPLTAITPDLARAVTAAPSALAGVLLADVDQFERIDEPDTDRFLDLPAAAALQPDPSEEVALLETRGFQGGWTRAFRSSANDVMVTSVYHFESSSEAEFYLEDGLITIGGYGGKFFDIDDLPGVRGFVQEFEADGEALRSLGAAFQAGPRWYLVYLVGAPATVTPEVLVSTVSAQRRAALAELAPADPVAVP